MEIANLDYILGNIPPDVVSRGFAYYEVGAVKSGVFHGDTFKAIVKGTHYYEVLLKFKGNTLTAFNCTCPYVRQYDSMCKHVVAALLYIHKSNGDLKRPWAIKRKDVEAEVLNELFSKSREKKQPVKVEYIFEFFPHGGYDFISRMHMKLGMDRMYILRDVKRFFEVWESGRPYEFGKKFTFNPMLHGFSEEDENVFSILKEIYEIEKKLYWQSPKVFFNERYVNLTYGYLKKIAAALGQRKFHMTSPHIEIVSFETRERPFSVAVIKEGDGISVRATGDFGLPLDRDYRLLYKDKKIYVLDTDDPAFTIVKGIFLKYGEELRFEGENQRKFISLIDRFENDTFLEISPDLKDAVVKRPLKLTIKIEGYKKGIAADVKFVYGEKIIDPFSKTEDDLILRDYGKEEYILKLFRDSGFELDRGRLVLIDEEKLYTFIKDIAPRLAGMGEVYYSSDVKHLFSTKAPKIRPSVRSLAGNLLEIRMDMEGIDEKTAEEILRAIKEKKKYFRLKDGSFLSLEGDEVKGVEKLLEDVPKEDIKQNSVNLSKYRFLGLVGKLKSEDSLPIEGLAEFEKVLDRIVNSRNQRIEPPKSLAGVLREYQVTGFKWMKVLAQSGLGGILADDMGLGKTLQAIAFLLSAKEEGVTPRTSLVVAPSTLIYNWENEISKFAPELRVMVVAGTALERKKKIKRLGEYDVVITSYSLLRNDADLYAKHEFHALVLDEAQHIKNFESLNAKSAKRINSRVRFALTGTPMENSPAELWSIFDFIMPGYLFSYKKFNEIYQKPIMEGDKKAIEELKKLISPFVLRRTKKDVLKELPEKIETTLKVDMTPQQKKLYLSYLMKIKGEIEERIEREGFEKTRMHIFSGLLRLRQICCHPGLFIENYRGKSGKIELLEELLSELVESGHRVLVFSQFTSMLSIIRESLDRLKIDYAYLDGSTGVSERKRIVDDFNSGKGKVFLLSLKAGGVGLNLTSADTVIHFDPWWNPAVEEQAADRAYRMGQENNVQVFRLITRGTIEEKIDELQKRKRDLISSIVSEGEVFINALSKEEIMELFRVG
ncbi:DEAD/DEAH box helicase [Thermovorax subterraneus]|nr:DEAD/DEAH box helicase [Thermovorax subterraneus]